ncbi:hypothetical protein ACLOJK_035972 [Asimina triloba]
MSRREESRDSNHYSKRPTSRADKDASRHPFGPSHAAGGSQGMLLVAFGLMYRGQIPKRPRRDGKPVTERTSSNNLNLENSNAASPDRKHRRWFQDALPLETAVAPDSKSKQDVLDKGSEKKPEEPLDVTRQSSNPTEVSRSRSYFQHDERSSAGQGGRSFNRREHGRTDQKDRSGDGTRDKIVAHDEKGDERNPSRVDKSVWRHDGFYELESEATILRKRPAFREKKMALESENATVVAAAESSKPTRFIRPLPDNTRREIKEGYHSHGTDNNPERPHVETDGRNTRTGDRAPHRGEARKGGFPSKERFGSSRSFRGRDRLGGRYGERNQHRQSGFHVEKWKHDLFDEANRSPTPKNEDDQIAKPLSELCGRSDIALGLTEVEMRVIPVVCVLQASRALDAMMSPAFSRPGHPVPKCNLV